jgi:hypothetical protein
MAASRRDLADPVYLIDNRLLPVTWSFHVPSAAVSDAQPNPTNGLFVSTNMPKITCTSLRLQALYVPKTQTLVEEGINDEIQWEEGGIVLDPTINGLGVEATTLSVNVVDQSDPNTITTSTFVSTVMPTLNPVTAYLRTSATTLQVTTQFPHGLDTFVPVATPAWSPIELVNTGYLGGALLVTQSNVVPDGALDNVFTVTFSSAICDFLEAEAGDNTFLWLPPYPNLQTLVGLVAQGFHASAASNFVLGYSAATGAATITSLRGPSFSIALNQWSTSPTGSLPRLLGLTGSLFDLFNNLRLRSATIPAGNGFTGNLDGVMNRWSIQRPTVPLLAPVTIYTNGGMSSFTTVYANPFFVFIDGGNASHLVYLMGGQYTLASLALYLQDQLTGLDPTQVYTVTVEALTNRLTFRSSVRTFALDFSAVDPSLAGHFGFLSISYSGSRVYQGASLGTDPTLGTDQSNQLTYVSTVMDGQPLQITAGPTRMGALDLDAIVQGDGTVFVHSFNGAVVVRLHDVLSITTTNGSEPTKMLVWQVLDPFTFVLRPPTGQFTLALTGPLLDAMVAGNNSWGWRSDGSAADRMLGFVPAGFTSATAGQTLSAPFPLQLFPPPYLLVSLLAPANGSSLLSQTFGTSTRSNVIAKLDMGSGSNVAHLDYNVTQDVTFYSTTGITGVQLELLNPDLTRYQLHGQGWGATILFRL